MRSFPETDIDPTLFIYGSPFSSKAGLCRGPVSLNNHQRPGLEILMRQCRRKSNQLPI